MHGKHSGSRVELAEFLGPIPHLIGDHMQDLSFALHNALAADQLSIVDRTAWSGTPSVSFSTASSAALG